MGLKGEVVNDEETKAVEKGRWLTRVLFRNRERKEQFVGKKKLYALYKIKKKSASYWESFNGLRIVKEYIISPINDYSRKKKMFNQK